ncbi:TonB-dependent receptor [Massilia soli]|uniref:TonB-dependent receptor n=1 Tax=Massilia soli TaxID=2792854 RepID=A0ABS7STI2_9BURK|nr:TonB-dependent receptor [Massilia soli]MBZ2209254.1 TonB-dependent receptor [Massilia soli]
MNRLRTRLLAAAIGAWCCQVPAYADPMLPAVLIHGARDSGLGRLDSASAGSVSRQQLEARTVYRPGELLEAAPGVLVTQHSGEGKANQFFLRGFNLDHGTDLRTTVDDMPVNQRSHAHGQGWTDLNFLMPELAARLDYKKGPYSAREGDFASAGSASVIYANRLARSIASIAAGQHGYRRAMTAASPEAFGGNLLYALELLHKDGPFTTPEDYRKVNAVLRYSRGYANNGFSVAAMAYRGRWNASDQIPQRAVDAGTIGRFDTVDASDGGDAQRYSVSGTWRRTATDSASKVNAFVIRNRTDLYSNFTYFLNDPVNGDQFAQPDRRVTSGLNATHSWHLHGARRATDITAGVQLQNDNIFNGLLNTRERRRLSATREDHVVESSAGMFIEASTQWNPMLRTTAGLRSDHYRFKVGSDRAANSGAVRDHLASPSLSIVLAPASTAELYFNMGTGFHSNDARGTTAAFDPASGDAVQPAPGLVRSRGIEAGLRIEPVQSLQTGVAVYRLAFDSELTYLGDAGATEAGLPSVRHGVEVSNSYKPVKWLSIDLDLAYAHARSRGAAPGQAHIAGAVEGVGQLGVTVSRRGAWSGSANLRYAGPRPLVEDNSVRRGGGATLNGRIGYRVDSRLRLELEGFNLLDRRDAAISYYYSSRLPGESQARDDVHFHPLEPRNFRLSAILQW